jgi:large subunit ribosomal protein L3
MATKGLLARKIGMTQVYSEKGELLPVTVLEAGPCVVVARRSTAREGYDAIQLGFGAVKDSRVNKPQAGRFKKAGVKPQRHLREVRLRGGSLPEVGQSLTVEIFSPGELVDVSGTSKGKGFAGQHRRHHFGRGPVTHGSHNIKQPGSIGSSSTPSRVYRGMRMAGHLGNAKKTSQHLRVVTVDAGRNLLMVSGAVPGHANSVVLVQDSRRQPGKKR